MMKNAITRWDLVKEIFGRGHSWSYRMFRLREWVGTFSNYYEVTVIPAIILGCLTALLQPLFAIAMNTGEPNLPTIGGAFGLFLFFLVPMTIEHIWDAYRGGRVAAPPAV